VQGEVQMENPYTDDISIFHLLRNTLWHLRRDPEFRQDDPAVIDIERNLALSIAQLEFEIESASTLTPDEPIRIPRIH
jgi:hypothetical protein